MILGDVDEGSVNLEVSLLFANFSKHGEDVGDEDRDLALVDVDRVCEDVDDEIGVDGIL